MFKHDKSTLALSLVTLGFLGFIFFGRSLGENSIPVDSSLDLTPELISGSEAAPNPDWHQLLKGRCSSILQSSEESNQDWARQAASQLEALVENDIALMRANIDPLLGELASFKGASHLAFLMTRDKVSGSSKMPKYVDGKIRPKMADPLLDLLSAVEARLLVFEDQLSTQATELSTEIIAYAGTLDFPADDEPEAILHEFQIQQQAFLVTISEISTRTAVGSVGAGLTAIFARVTIAMARNVLGHIAGRMATATGVGVTASALDGPFPFGEAILVVLEVGGAAWSGYDIHKAQVILKRDLRQQLNESIDDAQRDIRRNIFERIQLLLEQHQKLNRKLVDEILQVS
ncbi:MAG: hypothetical protein HOK49_03645 [Opitutae bacterium]|mgnify:FL=1|nr:hypothetical protein [Opitutae bacterium]MBT5690033.1 hypothetical protein [Opitutae bacterium]MBT6461613.1 hypothetical protein [Opitutae bacterium]MBT7853680.1 hypothetical protein [Opitutae bacterium]